jgi:hypothetical protein
MVNLRRAAVALVLALSASASAAFLAAAALRRLNFDEALALRSGWLLLAGIPAEPPFAMPFTILLGALAHVAADPGTVFLLARLVVALAVVSALAILAIRTAGSPAEAAATVLFTLLQGAFFVHGLEFRYDAAILVCLLLAIPLLARGREPDFVVLGVFSGWLATHHIKGLFLGGVLLALAAVRGRGGRRALVRLLAGAAAAAGIWFAVAAALGIGGAALGVYRSFLDVSVQPEVRAGLWESLRAAFLRDAAWWVAALVALVATFADLRRWPAEEALRAPGLWAALLSVASLAFTALHPHPWPYLLSLPAPFLALLMSRWLAGLRSRARRTALAAFVLAFAAQGLTSSPPLSAHFASFRASRSTQVETLRLLRAVSRPGDTILDPSGMAYFLPPCSRQWYLDTLFGEAARRGAWMADLPSALPEGCTWILDTYRLQWLPRAAWTRTVGRYVVARGSLALRAGDPRLAAAQSWPPLPPGALASFW